MSNERSAAAILAEAVASFAGVVSVAAEVEAAADLMTASLRAGGKIFFCGNGGSAADAQHLAAEFLGRYLKERAPLPAVALSVNSSTVTAIANDYGYEEVFSRQLAGLGRPGDVIVGLSTSGRSRNIVRAFETAKTLGIKVIAVTGETPGAMSALSDVAIRVPSTLTPRIQEMHITVGHTICEIVEERMSGSDD